MIGKIYKRLSDFPEDEQMFMVALMYRVGVWISYSDTDGGIAAMKKEAQALADILASYANNVCESGFVQEVAERALLHQDKWEDWRKDYDSFPSECQRAIEILTGAISPEDLMSFKSTLLEVAVSVARAFNERYEQQAVPEKIRAYASTWLSRAMARIQGVGDDKLSLYDSLKISPAEESALMDLVSALRADLGDMAEHSRRRRAPVMRT